jgi:hypothetical protein
MKHVLHRAASAAVVAMAAATFGCASKPTTPDTVAEIPKPSPTDSARTAESATALTSASERNLTIPAGTLLHVRIDETIDTKRHSAGHRFTGTLTTPVVADGETLLARGTTVGGVVANAASSGRLRGRAAVALALQWVEVNGANVPVQTSSVTKVSADHKKRNLLLIGGGSGLGALIGGLAGGPKGVLIGAGAGAAAGTAGAAATGKRQVRIPAESVLTFRLREPVTV